MKMAKLTTHLFTVFDREDFTYRKTNTKLMNDYKTKWGEWKNFCSLVVKNFIL